MKILLDLQAMLTASKNRGIGRYAIQQTVALSAICKEQGHELFALFNDMFPSKTVEAIQGLSGIIKKDNCITIPLPGISNENEEYFQLLRETVIARLHPDFLLIFSVFDYPIVMSIKKFFPNITTGIVIHDFMPFWDNSLLPKKEYRDSYLSLCKQVAHADVCFCNSHYTQSDLKKVLGDKVKNSIYLPSAPDETFSCKKEKSIEEIDSVLSKYQITKKFFLYCGGTDKRKNISELILSFSLLPKSYQEEFQIVIVCGRGLEEEPVHDLKSVMVRLGLTSDQCLFTGYITDEDLSVLYYRCFLFVFPSLNEGFGITPLEAVCCGATAITSNTSALPEVFECPDSLFDPCDPSDLKELMIKCIENPQFKKRIQEMEQVHSKNYSWQENAKRILKQVKDLETTRKVIYERSLCAQVVKKMKPLIKKFDDARIRKVSECLGQIFLEKNNNKRLFIDITQLLSTQPGYLTGCQRVINELLKYFLMDYSNTQFLIYPVYRSQEKIGFYYAHEYMENNFKTFSDKRLGNSVEFFKNDILLETEFSSYPIEYYRKLQSHGICIIQIIYDLVPILYPQTTVDGLPILYEKWLSNIAFFDGIIGDSKSVIDDYNQWFESHQEEKNPYQGTAWCHLGSDFKTDRCSISQKEEEQIGHLGNRTTFIMVSTIEPRKNYAQALDAFDILWNKGVDCNLVIVGRVGWKQEETVTRIKSSKFFNKRLFWFAGISDDFLLALYKKADAMLMTSIAEGFGLGIVESARQGKPLILRDIPVFREIAKDSATYFSGMSGEVLADVLVDWIANYQNGFVVDSGDVECLSWKESSSQFFQTIKKMSYSNSNE